MRSVVVGITGSDAPEAALLVALDEALRRRLPLEVVHAVQLPAFGDAAPLMLGHDAHVRRTAEDEARASLARALDAVPGATTLDLSVHVVQDNPAHALLSASQGAALVVVGRRGGGAVRRGLRGSVSAEVLHRCWAPVLLVPPEATRFPDRGTASQVVVGVDGSAASQAALTWAVAQAIEWGSVLVPVVIVAPGGRPPAALVRQPDLPAHGISAELWRRVRDAGGHALEVHPEIRHGHVVRELMSVPTPGDLLVVGARGGRAGQSLLLGSTSTKLAETCHAPVVVVREGQARRETQRRVVSTAAKRR